MCGIFGIWQHPAVSQIELKRLIEAGTLLSHRGPDHLGTYADFGIGMVHTRLSLVDLNPRSNQPYSDPTGQHQLVYNGEIYNFRELRSELSKLGIAFSTTSDTEVLLAGLIAWGFEETLIKLEGMFAFAWYDHHREALTLARDRFGMKPLFYCDDGQTLLFASEVCGFEPWLKLRPDPYSIAAWLQRGSPPTQRFTLYEGIQILPPGCLLRANRHQAPTVERYFDLLQFRDPKYAGELSKMSIRSLVDQVDEKLSSSVAMQLAADVPVGAFCSGGVDSSVVMGMAARHHDQLAIFHANVVGRHSEYDAAKQLADHLKLNLLSVDVEDHHFLDQLPIATRHFGHPIAYRQDSIPLLMVSHLVQEQGTRAVISGEGADEIFLGYQWLMPQRRLNLGKVKALPIAIKNIAKRLIQGRYAQFHATTIKQDLSAGLLSRFEVEIENAARLASGPERDTLSLRMLHYHLRTLLHRNDAIGMSASIECRFPLLDSQLVRLAVNLPYRTKIRNSWLVRDWRHPFIQNKWILREVASRYMPKSLSLRPKRPFPTNAFERMTIPADYLVESSAASLLKLSRRETDFLIEHGTQEILLRLMHLSVWHDVCIDREDPNDVARRLERSIVIRPDRWKANK